MLELKHIRKAYKVANFTQVALDDVSVSFRDNEFVAVLGPSGSGKTTMLNILGGLDHADSGDIVINGISTKDYRSKDWDTYRNHRVGFIFQSYNLIPHQTILSNVELALTLSGVGRTERKERARSALEAVGLGEHVNKRPNQLSGGQMQRVAIARALVNNPDIVLADEPTGALDTQTGIQVMDILKQVAQDRLVVMVTHNPELAEQYATRIVRLRDGRITDDTDPIRPEEALATAPAGVAGPAPDNEGVLAPDSEGAQTIGPEGTAVLPAVAPANPDAAPRDARSEGKGKKASMSLLTALSLSFNNLMTKKGRTFMTAFAGSIGIIGIAAILALSNGVNNYIYKTEQDTLSSYPVQLTESSADLTGLLTTMMSSAGGGEGSSSGDESQAQPAGTDVIPESTMVSDMVGQVQSNDLGAFKTYLDGSPSEVDDHVSTIVYKYGVEPLVYASDTSSGVTQLGNPLSAGTSSLAMASAGSSLGLYGSSSSFEELLDDQDLLESQYDVVAGTWPTSADEAVLVLGQDGSISDYTLYAIGVLDPAELRTLVQSIGSTDASVETPDTHVDLTYDDALALTFKVVGKYATYQKNDETGTWTDMSDDADYMRSVVDGATTLRVVGVIRPNATTDTAALQEGIAYTHALTQQLMRDAEGSAIVQEQLANPDVDVFTGQTFDELREGATSSFDMGSIFSVDEDALRNAFSFDSSSLEGLASGDGSMGDLDLSGLDLSSMDLSGLDLSGLDTSQLTSVFTPEAIASLISNAPQPDLDSLLQEVDPSRTEATREAVSQLASGFATYFWQNYLQGDYSAYTNEDGSPNTDKLVTDAAAAWQAYITSDETGQQLYAQAQAAVGTDVEDISQQLQSTMQSYLTDQFVPYFEEQMGTLMQQAAQVMAQQMAQALQSTIANATQSLGSELSSAISEQLQGQMGTLTDALQNGFSVDADAFRNAIHFNMTQDDLTSLLTNYAQADQLTYDNNLTKLGYANEDDPHEIDLYPKSFEDKEAVFDAIDAYNQRMRDAGQDDKVISYSDTVGALMSSVTDIVNIVSLVLIAFVSISLVVSSIMIAIITYISVIERKKEIGILRAMGASKLNVANVFNAETFIEGLISGVFAILVVLIVEVPVNAYVLAWRHVQNIMALSAANAAALIGISVLLTVVAGLIPSSIAAKRDPVEALRSE